MLPLIKFREMTKEENIDIIKWAYFEDDDLLNVKNYVLEYFEELSKIKNDFSKEEINKIIEEVVTKYYYKNLEKIKSETKKYNEIWNKYNDVYFKTLSNYLNIKWPNIKKITATVGLIPIFPRYLDTFSFSISTEVEEWKLLEVCAHETLHFLWFEKWHELYPQIPKIEYDSPYLSWQYSEMVTDPILNNQPFNKIFPFTEHSYDCFYELFDNNILVMDKLRNLYSKNISIEEKITTGYEYIKSYQEGRS